MKTIAPQALCWAPVTLADKAHYAPIADIAQSKSADHAFTNLYIWNETYHQEIALLGDRAAVRFGREGDYRYLFPIGKGPVEPILTAIFSEDPAARFVAVTEEELETILAIYPDTFDVAETRDCEDYLYSAESLATLAGKKLHGKRNHINAFTAAHDWSVHPLTPSDFDTCRAILDIWRAEHGGDTVESEHRAIERAFGAFGELELYGAYLIADGQPVAFTLGSMIADDTLCVHVEKALSTVNGAYPTINREFVRMMRERFPALAFVNREDDMGLENLRAAKLSYRPAAMVRKFTLTQKTRGL